MKILYKIPSRNRFPLLFDMIEKIHELTELPDYRILVSLDADDIADQSYETRVRIEEMRNEITVFKTGKSLSKIDAVNRDINDFEYDWDIIVVLSDDHKIMKKGFDKIISDFFLSRFPDTDGCPNFWDGNRDDDLITLAVMGRKYYHRFDYVYHPDYQSFYCDNEMTEVAFLLNKYAKYKECIIQHKHPSFHKDIPFDSLYQRNENFWQEDYNTLEDRKNRLFDLPKNKIISYCLWGEDNKYIQGALQNVDLAKEIYPEFITKFYVDESISIETLSALSKKGALIERYRGFIGWKLMLYRFLPIEHPLTEIMLSRDTDSRPSARERKCVDEFIASDKKFHTIHDHPYHNLPILGGMWAAKRGIIDNISDLIAENIGKYPNKYQCDQTFLAEIILPIVENDILVHSDYVFYPHRHISPIDMPRENYEFIGSVYDENNNRYEDYHEILKKYLDVNSTSKLPRS